MRSIVFGLLVAAPALAQDPATAPPPPVPSISADGQAEATTPPDRATLLIAVETRAATAAAASADNARRVRATLDTLRAVGLGKDQLGTSGFTVQPLYATPKLGSGETMRISGYVARNTVRAEVRKLDDVGRSIDAALAGGANSIGDLQFRASNADSARRDALSRATAQARGDAEAMARAAGGTIGPMLEIASTGGNAERPVMQYSRITMAKADGGPTPIDAGPITVSASVHARWQFVPGGR